MVAGEENIMTSAKGGRPQKGAAITEGYNPKKTYKQPTARQLRGKKNRQLREALAAKKNQTAQPASPVPTQDEIDAWGVEPTPAEPIDDSYELPPPVGTATPTGRVASSPPAGADGSQTTRRREDDDEGDDNFARDLMEDMRWVYRQINGREKLRTLMGQDKEFISLVKELMKLEAAYLTSKMKGKGTGSGGAGFLVVLKGLEGDDKLVADMKKDKIIDLKQIERALNPAAELLGPADDDTQDERMGIPPTTIIKKGLTVEEEEAIQEAEAKPTEEDTDGW